MIENHIFCTKDGDLLIIVMGLLGNGLCWHFWEYRKYLKINENNLNDGKWIKNNLVYIGEL